MRGPPFSPSSPTSLSDNTLTADAWERFGPHRRKLTGLVRGLPIGRGGRLCVLGAGNGTSLDLEELAGEYEQVCIVDRDGAALERARARLSAQAQARVFALDPIDLAPEPGLLGRWRSRPPTLDELAALTAREPTRLLPRLPGPFDAAVSDCLLAGLYQSVYQALGNGRILAPALRAVLAGHLRLLAGLLRPGGSALVATETASSTSVPELSSLFADTDPTRLVKRLGGQGDLYTGTSPVQLTDVLLRDALLGPALERLEVVPPWLWTAGSGDAAELFLAYAVSFRRRA